MAIAGGDREAFTTLFRWLAPRLKAHFQSRGLSSDIAETLTADTMVAVWRQAASFRPDESSAMAWLFARAREVWLRWSATGSGPHRGLVEGVTSVVGGLPALSTRPPPQADVRRLAPGPAAVFHVLVYGRSIAETAALIGISLSAVSHHLETAVRRLAHRGAVKRDADRAS